MNPILLIISILGLGILIGKTIPIVRRKTSSYTAPIEMMAITGSQAAYHFTMDKKKYINPVSAVKKINEVLTTKAKETIATPLTKKIAKGAIKL